MHNKNGLHFHFALGPVQDFIAQARRTRDFWAGSFLLSWLSGVAMLAVKKQGGKILFPKPNTDYLEAIAPTTTTATHGPQQGSIPNRFTAVVQQGFDADYVRQTVLQAWNALAEHIWTQDFDSTKLNEKQKSVAHYGARVAKLYLTQPWAKRGCNR